MEFYRIFFHPLQFLPSQTGQFNYSASLDKIDYIQNLFLNETFSNETYSKRNLGYEINFESYQFHVDIGTVIENFLLNHLHKTLQLKTFTKNLTIPLLNGCLLNMSKFLEETRMEITVGPTHHSGYPTLEIASQFSMTILYLN